MHCHALAIHGGAGDLSSTLATPAAAKRMTEALERALEEGHQLLRQGRSALDAAVRAVAVLEDCPLFNAGRGAVLRSDGSARLDASVMCGHTHHAGAVAGARRVQNPILLARHLLEAGGPVLLAGIPADERAEAAGLAMQPPEYFVTGERHAQWQRAHAGGRVSLDHDEREGSDSDAASPLFTPTDGQTVGAVARDALGHLAAATSTGGLTNADPGRVGDSPIIGAGTFADDATCAVSATGTGEAFIRCAFAHGVHLRQSLTGAPLEQAIRDALQEVKLLGGRGGCVAIDRDGAIQMPFNTQGMPRASLDRRGTRVVLLSS